MSDGYSSNRIAWFGDETDIPIDFVPGRYYRDRWTGCWVIVVYGAQTDGYTTVQFANGHIVSIRTDHLEEG